MDTIEFQLRGEHIRLCDLLKVTGIAESGGQGKRLVAAGEVKVDGQSESRKSVYVQKCPKKAGLPQAVSTYFGRVAPI